MKIIYPEEGYKDFNDELMENNINIGAKSTTEYVLCLTMNVKQQQFPNKASKQGKS